MKSKRTQKVFLVPLLLALCFGVSHYFHATRSASLSSVSVTTNNPRPAFRGSLASGNTAGSTTVIINTTAGSHPSTSSAQLVEGDIVKIGDNGTLTDYLVASTSSLSTFTIVDDGSYDALGTGDIESGDAVISTQSATLTVRATTVNAIANGRFRILVPALASDANSSDGIPDGGFFDFKGSGNATVTCPATATAVYDYYTVGGSGDTGAATASAQTINGTDYHVFECAYSGTGAAGTSAVTFTINNIMNPAPKSNHTTGTADTYNVIVQQLDSSLSVQDTTTVQIGVIEAVKVTASVPAQITFQILGLASGASACGLTTDVETTPASVPFGEVSIANFTDAAQSMNVSTNAAGGFTVTAEENDQLGRNGGTCTGDPTITSNTSCIADSRGDGGTMTDSTSAEWNTAAAKGFAYSLHDVNGSTTEAFAYNESSRTFSARQFADIENSGTPQTIFSSTGPADNQNLYVCYRVIVGATTAAGNYENNLEFNATATF